MKYSASTNGFYDLAIHAAHDLPGDLIDITTDHHRMLLDQQSKGCVIQPGPDGMPQAAAPVSNETAAQTFTRLRTTVQSHLDAQAQALNYDDIRTAVTYADEPAVPRFQAEGIALRAWRSRVWDAAYAVLNAFQAGERPAPSAAELIAVLPVYINPADAPAP